MTPFSGSFFYARTQGQIGKTASSAVICHPGLELGMAEMIQEMGKDAPAVAVLPAPRTATCGDHGGRRNDGSPCGQKGWGGQRRCPLHPPGGGGGAPKP